MKDPKGFTLTEILVYIALFSLLISAVISFTLWAFRSYAKARAIREVSADAKRTMEMIALSVKTAESVYTPTTNAHQLSLETKQFLPEGETNSYLDFYFCQGHICLKKESEAPIVLTGQETEVSDLSFEVIGFSPPSVKINLFLNFKNPENKPEYEASINLSSTVCLRRY